ncbi:FecCD family ABC transporter permease [Pontiella sp.]|uniref:FecCD family ABC transporter permease n=1 Tax=Pontiella sp. TaxID=2837462 RepID=UPI0035636C62
MKYLYVILGLAIAAALSLGVGGDRVTLSTVFDYFAGKPVGDEAEYVEMVIHSIRIPRTLGAIVVGICFGLAGAILQTVTRNRLAETDLLGINGGAALGVVLGLSYFGTESVNSYMVWSFGGAMAGTALVVAIAGRGGISIPPLRLVLTGLAIASTVQGILGYILISHQSSLDQYRFWVLGSLAGISMQGILAALPGIGTAILITVIITRSLGALRLGEDVARGLGHHPAVTRFAAITAVTLLTGSAIALTGPVVLLGLIAPYGARHLVKSSMSAFFMVSALMGAAVLLLADSISRVVVQPYESPVSVVVVLIGAPLLIHIARSPKQLSSLNNG